MLDSTQKPVIQFEIGYTQFLDENGNAVLKLPEFKNKNKNTNSNANVDADTNTDTDTDYNYLKSLYSMMILNRVFDTRAITLQRTGKLGTYTPTLGQEAIGTGIGAAMKPIDVLCPYYRDYSAQFQRGVRMAEILLYWGGDERGSHFSNPNVKEDLPICVPIASQTLHAAGIATAIKLRKENRVVLTTLGDGGTSRGDFYEAVNLAGVWNLPIVFVINNNHWAISLPLHKQTAAKTVAQKGIAGGLHCEQVDGNDVIAVHYVVERALERARHEKKASVIEAISYRLGDHTTADDAKRYRDINEVERFKLRDPIHRLNVFLTKNGQWDEVQEKNLHEWATEEVNKAVEEYLNTPMDSVTSLFDFQYANLPHAYSKQREEALVLEKKTLENSKTHKE